MELVLNSTSLTFGCNIATALVSSNPALNILYSEKPIPALSSQCKEQGREAST